MREMHDKTIVEKVYQEGRERGKGRWEKMKSRDMAR
jgi:hypothetical protein